MTKIFEEKYSGENTRYQYSVPAKFLEFDDIVTQEELTEMWEEFFEREKFGRT